MEYNKLMFNILEKNIKLKDRTGTGTLTNDEPVMLIYDCNKGIPITTGKSTHLKSVIGELCWFLRGSSNYMYLSKNGITIWDEWLTSYSGQKLVKCFYPTEMKANLFPLIENIKESITTNNRSRRFCMSLWNDYDIRSNPKKIPPCHGLTIQFVIDSKNKLNVIQYQRSADIFLGLPFDITSYAILLHIVAREVGLEVGKCSHIIGEPHIYLNHVEQCKKYLESEKEFEIFDINILDDFNINLPEIDKIKVNYNPNNYPKIKAEVSV